MLLLMLLRKSAIYIGTQGEEDVQRFHGIATLSGCEREESHRVAHSVSLQGSVLCTELQIAHRVLLCEVVVVLLLLSLLLMLSITLSSGCAFRFRCCLTIDHNQMPHATQLLCEARKIRKRAEEERVIRRENRRQRFHFSEVIGRDHRCKNARGLSRHRCTSNVANKRTRAIKIQLTNDLISKTKNQRHQRSHDRSVCLRKISTLNTSQKCGNKPCSTIETRRNVRRRIMRDPVHKLRYERPKRSPIHALRRTTILSNKKTTTTQPILMRQIRLQNRLLSMVVIVRGSK